MSKVLKHIYMESERERITKQIYWLLVQKTIIERDGNIHRRHFEVEITILQCLS